MFRRYEAGDQDAMHLNYNCIDWVPGPVHLLHSSFFYASNKIIKMSKKIVSDRDLSFPDYFHECIFTWDSESTVCAKMTREKPLS